MENRELTHIQNTAPAPPAAMADATPAMFPTPSVPASARVTARNGDTPSPDGMVKTCIMPRGARSG